MDDAVARGATVVLGGKQDIADRFMEPTILCDVDPESRVMQVSVQIQSRLWERRGEGAVSVVSVGLISVAAAAAAAADTIRSRHTTTLDNPRRPSYRKRSLVRSLQYSP